MSDVILLTALGSKENYTRFSPIVKDYTLTKESYEIFKGLEMYYKAYPSVSEVNWDEFETIFFMTQDKKIKDRGLIYRGIIQACKDKQVELDASPDKPKIYAHIIKHYTTLDFVTQITNVALDKSANILNGKDETLDDIAELVDAWRKECQTALDTSTVFVPRNITKVVATVSSTGFSWPLAELNISLGPIRPGDLIILAARPEAGKTTMCAHAVWTFATQMPDASHPVIWVNNEESSSKVMFRIMQSYFGITSEELIKNALSYEKRYVAEIGDRILVLSDDSGYNSVTKLDRLFKEYSPAVVVIDQLDKVDGFKKALRDDIRLGSLYGWARVKAKEGAGIIAVSQVDGTGEGQEWLQQNQLRGSKTDKQGEGDAIVLIGKSNDLAKASARFLSVPKNKLLGGPLTKESFRHGMFTIKILPEIGRYEGGK